VPHRKAAPLSIPLILLLVGGGACAAAIAVFLLQRPLIVLNIAIVLYLFPFGLRPIDVGSLFDYATDGMIVLALCAWLLHAPFQRQPIRWNIAWLLLALFILWASVTLLWATDVVEGRKALVGFLSGSIMLFLVVQQVRTIQEIDGVMRDLMIVGWFVVIAGLLTLRFGDYQSGERLKIGDLNENAPGVLLTLMLAGVIWPALRTSGRARLVYMAVSAAYILSTVILVLLSGSRGSTISLVVMLLAFWFWKPLRPWAKMGSALVVGALIVAPILLIAIQNRSSENTGNELGSRDILWTAAWRLIQDHPFTGVGIGNGPVALRPYIAALTIDYAERLNLPAHNPFLEVGCDTGLLGMSLFASVLISAIWQFLHNRRRLEMHGGALSAYFPLILICAAGYISSFMKSGGMENHPTFFVLLALLLIPSQLTPNYAVKPVGRPVSASLRRSTLRLQH
jgi:putative inorganic carbon (HCO3(-)) transporter